MTTKDKPQRPVEPDFGWFGAGWACFKKEELIAGFVPALDDEPALFEWFDGFAAAHADYPDAEAMAGILEGDFSRGESFDDALFRIMKFRIYDYLSESKVLERYEQYCDKGRQ